MDEDFVEAVHAAVEDIPAGRVRSYGAVAASIGSRAPRAVGRVLRHTGSTLPWWRVIRADGTVPDALRAAAREHYAAEGTPHDDDGARLRVSRAAFDDHDSIPSERMAEDRPLG